MLGTPVKQRRQDSIAKSLKSDPFHQTLVFRDVWHGTDMLGTGARRAQWNATLLKEAVAPAYALALVEAAKVLGPTEAYFRWAVCKTGSVTSSVVCVAGSVTGGKRILPWR